MCVRTLNMCVNMFVCVLLFIAIMQSMTIPAEAKRTSTEHFTQQSKTNDTVTPFCLGEYLLCPNSDCALVADWCGRCPAFYYLCPDGKTCQPTADAYVSCPNITGTHYDWTMSVEARIDYFLRTASVSDKIQQLQSTSPSLDDMALPSYSWVNDDIHSVNQNRSTVFPNGCGLGATWDRDILFNVGYTVGLEARATHNGMQQPGQRENLGTGMTTYAPNINLVRDPRWGRNQEVFSEDPFLTGRLSVSYVQGQQGSNETGTPYQMAGSCCKHFVGYDVESIPEDRHYFDAFISTRDLWESYTPAFEACVVDGKASSVMCSYNSMNGIPTCADPNLLNGVLRDRWNFTGFVVSDYLAWENIRNTHHYCEDFVCAATVGLKAGMDQELGTTDAIDAMPAALNAGNITENDIDTALRRQLRVRIELGMLDPPTLNRWNQLQNDSIQTDAHMQYARQVARKTMTLYRNENNTLPLSLDDAKPESANPISIALIGPQWIDANLLIGSYAVLPADPGVQSLMMGLFDVMDLPLGGTCTFQTNWDYLQPGETGVLAWNANECAAMCSTMSDCNFFTYYDQSCYFKTNSSGGQASPGHVSGACKQVENVQFAPGCLDIPCEDNAAFPQALSIVPAATHVFLSLGLEWYDLEAEGLDRANIDLPYFQYLLADQVRGAMVPGQKLICVFVHGGSFALRNLLELCDAVVDAHSPGQRGGGALWDVLFGLYNPGGKTTATWYAHTNSLADPGDMGFYPNATSGNQGMTYRFFQGEPTLPFGFGLSYTTFSYSNLSVVNSSPDACDWISASITVTNVGNRAGEEVVQAYVSQMNPSVPAPQIRLVGFERVPLAAGASATVTFLVDPSFHSVVLDEGTSNFWTPTRQIESGELNLSIGGGQPKVTQGVLSQTLQVTSTKPVDQCSRTPPIEHVCGGNHSCVSQMKSIETESIGLALA